MKRTGNLVSNLVAIFMTAALTVLTTGTVSYAQEVSDLNDFSVESQTAYSDDNITIFFDQAGINEDYYGEPVLEERWSVENTGDAAFSVYPSSAAVNGIYLPFSSSYYSLAPGETAAVSIIIPVSCLRMSGIDAVGTIGAAFRASVTETYTSVLDSELFSVETDKTGAGYQVSDTEPVLFDGCGVQVSYMYHEISKVETGNPTDNVKALLIMFLVQNRSDYESFFSDSHESISINGVLNENSFSNIINREIPAGSDVLSALTIYVEDIETIDSADFYLEIQGGENDDYLLVPVHFELRDGSAVISCDSAIDYIEYLMNQYALEEEDKEIEAAPEETDAADAAEAAEAVDAVNEAPKGAGNGLSAGTGNEGSAGKGMSSGTLNSGNEGSAGNGMSSGTSNSGNEGSVGKGMSSGTSNSGNDGATGKGMSAVAG